MRTLADPTDALGEGLAAIRREFQVPRGFPPAVLVAADAAAARAPTDHVDRTAMRFVTLDPAASTDLDQAFAIEAAGADLLLHYAIADVAWFVCDGDAVDREAWARGTTLYLPDGKASLYPPVLSEAAASLLPDDPRPAVVFTVRVGPDGTATLDGAERALVRSAAKLAYDTVTDADLPPGFTELARRIEAAGTRRGAVRVDTPEQTVEREAGSGTDGTRYVLGFRPPLPSERRNAALSLAANIAIADTLLAHRTGLFRVMARPDAAAVARLRHQAEALRLDWPEAMPLEERERTLDPADPRQAAFMTAIRRAGHGASYAPFRDGPPPWHAAMAATYVHATAPLRRLADRYVVMAALAVTNGRAVPDEVTAALERLPPVMARADALQGRIDRAVVDLAEAAMLRPRVGERFDAVVTDSDDRGSRFQLRGLPVLARVAEPGLTPGAALAVVLTEADPASRHIAFTLAS